jgi:hypothetical protein
MDANDDDPPQGAALRPRPYEEEIQEAQKRLTKFVSYITIANLMGLFGGIGVWRLFPEQDSIQDVVMTSAMIFAIGLASAIGSYAIFHSSMAISRDADAIVREAGDDETRLSTARDRQNEALGRIQSGMRTLKMAGICFVASTLIGFTGLLSI